VKSASDISARKAFPLPFASLHTTSSWRAALWQDRWTPSKTRAGGSHGTWALSC
jgi:hypothetical protein